MLKRLSENWVYGGFFAGLLLLCLYPLLARDWPQALLATYLCLPAHMIHQYEEHDDDRFRNFVNSYVARGRVGLTHLDVFIINVPGVWGVIAIALWLVFFLSAGYGLIAAYLLLVNGIVHVIGAVVFRKYNPGLITAIVIFIPLGAYCIETIQASGDGKPAMHALGLAVAILIHVAIIIKAMRREAQYLDPSGTNRLI